MNSSASVNAKTRPVPVVTGIGIICSLGGNKNAFWERIVSGQSGIGPVDLFDVTGYRSHIGGQVHQAELAHPRRLSGWRRLGRGDLLGLLAAEEAVREANLAGRNAPPHRVGVILGGGSGGVLEAERFRRALHSGRPARPSLLLPFPVCHLTDVLANVYGFLGPRATVATACSSSATAIGYAADLIRTGRADVVIAGGAESLTELTFAGFNSLRSLDPETCRPFDRHRQGLVLGEGAAILVIESSERVKSLPAKSYGIVAGYGISADAHHMTSPDPHGNGAARCMRAALADAGVSHKVVDYVNAHGTGTPVNDHVETLAIKQVFGKRAHAVPVSSTKSFHGHCLGAAGAMEAAATLLALDREVIPPTLHLTEADPECDLDYVPNQARKAPIRVALSNSFAFGGNNTTLVLSRWQGDASGAGGTGLNSEIE